MWRVHRLDRIWAKKPAKLLNSKSLTLDFSRQQIWPVFLPYRSKCLHRPSGGWSATLPEVGPARSRRRLDSDLIVHCRSDPLRTAEVTLGGLHGDVAQKELNLLQFALAERQRRAQLRRRSCGASLLTPIFAANSLTTCHTTFPLQLCPKLYLRYSHAGKGCLR